MVPNDTTINVAMLYRDYGIVQYEWEKALKMQDAYSSHIKITVQESILLWKLDVKIMLAWTYTHSDFHIIKDLPYLVFFSGLDTLGTT